VLVDRVADRQGEQARSAALAAPARAHDDGTADRGRGDAQVAPAAARDGERRGDDSGAWTAPAGAAATTSGIAPAGVAATTTLTGRGHPRMTACSSRSSSS
jgi:hypothetical protein